MIGFLKNNAQLVLLLFVWLFAGMALPETSYVIVPLSLLLLKRKERYTEMIIGFAMILFFADNRHHVLVFWASYVKDVTLVILALFVFLNSKEFGERSKLLGPFLLFLLFAFALTLRNPNPVVSFQKTLSFTLILAAIPNYFIKEMNRDGRTFLRNIIWFCHIFLLTGLILIFFLHKWVYTTIRFNGLLGSPNGIGTLCLLLTIFISVARYHYPDLFSKTELYFISGVILISVILSSSRNCLGSMIVFLFFIRFYRISYLYGFIIVIVSVIIFQFINENLITIITSLGLGDYMRVDHLNDGSGRVVAWAFAWLEIQRHFFIGQGFGYDKEYFIAHRDYLASLGHQGGVHNSYLTIWLNTGLIGLILFLIAFIRIFIKAASINYLAIPSMFAIMFTISFESWASSSLSPFTIIFLLIITLLHYKKNEAPAEKNLVPVQ